MLLPILERQQIADVHGTFVDRIIEGTDEEIFCNLNIDKETIVMPVQHKESQRFWACVWPDAIEDYNYWSAFGLALPRENQSLSVTLELSYPVEGMLAGFPAFWAIDGFTKKRYLLHLGKLRGRASGVSVEEFFRLWHGPVHEVGVLGGSYKCAEVCVLEKGDVMEQLHNFTKRVYQMGQMKRD